MLFVDLVSGKILQMALDRLGGKFGKESLSVMKHRNSKKV